MSQSILIIDDEPDIRQLLSITTTRMGLSPVCVEDVNQAIEQLDSEHFDLCLTDLRLPDGSGLDIVKYIQNNHSELPVIVITAHGSMDIAINAMKYGAFDFINKPVDLHHLRSLIQNALSLQQTTPKPQEFREITGESEAIRQLKTSINKVSRSQAAVFILGESGSGKELVARAIHNSSSRKDNAFIGINCGAIPKELMESELFGHVKGSFTGAIHDKQGLFQLANGGTLLLDEIADLPLDMQVKLLRVIQEKKIRPIGSQEELSVDVRVLSASHKNLSEAVHLGKFRSDLFYRLNVIEINVPPLRERVDDLHALCTTILEKISLQNNTVVKTVSDAAMALLRQYSFPGNVRELENILERACALTEAPSIERDNLLFLEQPPIIEAETTTLKPAQDQNDIPVNTPEPSVQYDSSQQSIDEYLEEIEKGALLNELEKNRWNRTATAKALGITFRSLRYRLKKLGLDVDTSE